MGRDLFFVLKDEETVAKITPDFSALKALDLGVGVIVTASGDSVDFVSRTFFPKLRINEDPVCGSAHANLIPYWGKRLNQTTLSAYQVSPRGGFLTCEVKKIESLLVVLLNYLQKEKRTYLYKSTPTASNSSLAVGVLFK